MSIFDSIRDIFKSESDGSVNPKWGKLTASSELSEIEEASYSKPQLIYKHSTRCANSYFALKDLQNIPESTFENINGYLVDVTGQRTLSGEVSRYFNIRHESPQVIIVKDGEVIWTASHGNVRTESILDVIE